MNTIKNQKSNPHHYSTATHYSTTPFYYHHYYYYHYRGKAYSDLYLLLERFVLVSQQRWRLPPHPAFLAVAQPSASRVGVLAFWPPQHACEYFPAFVRTRGAVAGPDLPGRVMNPQV